MSQPDRHEAPARAWPWLALLVVVSAVLSCADPSPTTPLHSPPHDKAVPVVRYLGYASPFVSDLLVASMAALPDRIVASTIGYPHKLVEIAGDGTICPIPVRLEAPSSSACQVALSPGMNPAFEQGEILVSVGPSISRVLLDPPSLQGLAALPPEEGDVAGLCFDTVGRFNFSPLVLARAGGVYRLDPNGNLQRIGDVGPGGSGPSVAASSFGHLAGHLVVAFPASGDVIALSPTGSVKRLTGWSGVTGAFAIPDLPQGMGGTDACLFVALRTGGSGRIVQFGLDQVTQHLGSLLLTSLYASGSGLLSSQNDSYSLHSWGRFLGAEVAAAFVQRVAVVQVEVDVRPGEESSILWGSQEPIAVGLLSSLQLDAHIVDASSARFAGAPALSSGKFGFGKVLDLNGDSLEDLLLSFRPADMQVAPGTQELTLEAQTLEGTSVRGKTSVLVLSP